MRAGTTEHFCYWAEGRLVLDSGKLWHIEDFQREIVDDLFAGFFENLTFIPEGNGKTTLLAGVALYHVSHCLSAFVPVAASSREQAEIMYRQAEGLVVRSKLTHQFKCQDGFRRIKCESSGGRLQVYAADDRTADGVIPSLALIDELHRHRNLRLYRTWSGKLDKRELQYQPCRNTKCCGEVDEGVLVDHGQLVSISTAGEPGSEFENVRTHILKTAEDIRRDGAHIRAATDTLVLHDWAVRDRARCEDMVAVAEANPLDKLTPDVLGKKRARPTMTAEHWQRFACNIATRLDEAGINPEEWDVLKGDADQIAADLAKCSYIIGGLDLGWKADCTAMIILGWHSHERRLVGAVRVIEPPVDELEVVTTLLDLDDTYKPRAWVYDESAGGQQMAQQLERGDHSLQQSGKHRNITWVSHNQANTAMALAAARADEAIRGEWIVHDGDLVLRQHVLNAVRHPIPGERFRFDRPKEATGLRRREFPIDAFTAFLMAHSVMVGEMQNGSGPMVMW